MITHEVDKEIFDVVIRMSKGAGEVWRTDHPMRDCSLFHYMNEYWECVFARHSWKDDSYCFFIYEDKDYRDYDILDEEKIKIFFP